MSVASVHSSRPTHLSLGELADLTRDYADGVRAGRYPVQVDDKDRWHVRLHHDDAVDVWLISWTTEQGTQLHDHGDSAGAFTVVEGALTESSWAAHAGDLDDHTRGAGDTVTFANHYVHDVRNEALPVAVSVHAYSPPLEIMNFYDVVDGRLERLASTWTDDPEQPPPAAGVFEFADVDDLLADARTRIERLRPADAYARVQAGARLVDIRPEWQRATQGEVPGAVIVESNHLLWRLHPRSGASLPAAGAGTEWIVVCEEGYASSLAAASLAAVGVRASDVAGGIAAWRAAGLPLVETVTDVESVVRRPGAS